MYGSLSIRFQVSLTKIINYFPAALDVIFTNLDFITGATAFDFEDHMSGVTSDYLWNTTGSTTQPQFGDEQPFPGSISLVRSTDIERMRFLVNLPSTQFNISQNPTYTTGSDKRITEIGLLNSNKEVLIIGKTSNPVKRSGTQVFSIDVDF
jgi:hypothetical protein